jgi:hypothetical protein
VIFYRSLSSADGATVAGQVKLRKICWSPTGAGSFVLQSNGVTVLTLTPAAAGIVNIDFPEEGLLLGLGAGGTTQVTTLTGGGTVYLYQD